MQLAIQCFCSAGTVEPTLKHLLSTNEDDATAVICISAMALNITTNVCRYKALLK